MKFKKRCANKFFTKNVKSFRNSHLKQNWNIENYKLNVERLRKGEAKKISHRVVLASAQVIQAELVQVESEVIRVWWIEEWAQACEPLQHIQWEVPESLFRGSLEERRGLADDEETKSRV